jgi:uncharacterized membrane protein
MLDSWLHLLALVIYIGAVVGLRLILLPSLDGLKQHEDRSRFLGRALRFYNPLHIGALGVLIITGAFQLTELKAIYRETFVQQVSYNLGVKLVLVFFLVILSVYQSMAIAHRFVKRQESGETVTPQELDRVVRRLKSMNWGILVLALFTLWFGIALQS